MTDDNAIKTESLDAELSDAIATHIANLKWISSGTTLSKSAFPQQVDKLELMLGESDLNTLQCGREEFLSAISPAEFLCFVTASASGRFDSEYAASREELLGVYQDIREYGSAHDDSPLSKQALDVLFAWDNALGHGR